MDEEISRLMDGELDDEQLDVVCCAAEATEGLAAWVVLSRDRRHAARHRAADAGVLAALRGAARGRADGAGAAGARAARPVSFAWAAAATVAAVGAGRLGGLLDARPAADGDGQGARGGGGPRAQLKPQTAPADYLLAHQEYSPTTQIQGSVPSAVRRRRLRRRPAPAVMRRRMIAARADRSGDDSEVASTGRLRLSALAALAVAALVAAPAARRGCRGVARARGRGGAAAQLRRHDRSTSTATASRPRASSTSTTTAAEFEKLVNLDGPAREVIRSSGEVRCYYPDAQGRARRAADVPQRLSVAVAAAAEGAGRVLRVPQGRDERASPGLEAQAWRVRAEGRPALRPQVLGRHRRPACCSRRACSNERGEVVEQFAFTDVAHRRRASTATWCKPVVAAGAAGLGGQAQLGPRRRRRPRHRLGRRQAAAGLRQDRRGLTAALRAQAHRIVAPRLLATGSSRCRCSSSPSVRRRIRPGCRSGAAERLHPPGRRPPRHRARRGARGRRPPDRRSR